MGRLSWCRSPVNPEPSPSLWQNGDGIFILKMIVLSAVISVGIKVLGPLLPLPATPAVALILVLGPPVILGGILLWRTQG